MRRGNVTFFNAETISVYDLLIAIAKRKWLILLVTLCVFICFFIYSVVTPDVYKTSNVIVWPAVKLGFKVSEIKSALAQFEAFPIGQQVKILGLKEEAKKTVKKIKLTEIKEEDHKKSYLKIEVDTHDAHIGVKVINALADYINKLPFVVKRALYTKALFHKNKDALIKIITDPSGHLNLSENIAQNDIIKSIFELKQQYSAIALSIDELEKGRYVILADETHIPQTPYKPARMKIRLVGLFVGILIGLFCGLFVEWISAEHRQRVSKQK